VRAAWWDEMQTYDPTALVFVDESGTNLAMTPRYGRAPRGQRVVGTVPRNQGKNTTLVAAMDLTGITAAMILEGAVDGAAFEVFVAQILAPSLRPGQIVVWDNLSVHKRAAARQLIEARGCQLRFLPSYSPDFSPIELAFSKLKTGVRRAGARTREGVDAAIAAGLRSITTADAHAWFRHCGYALSSQLL
jgi:transposase